MKTNKLTDEAFILRGEWIQMVAKETSIENVKALLQDDKTRSMINAMMQLMADAGVKPASQSNKCKEVQKNEI